jgi:hypothetical protein
MYCQRCRGVQCDAAASGIRECNGTQCPGRWGAIALIVTVEFAVDVIQLQRTRARGRRTLPQSWSRVTPGTVTIDRPCREQLFTAYATVTGPLRAA